MASPIYRSRKPKASPLWQCLIRNFDDFLGQYEECYCKRYGFLRPIIAEVVHKFLDCGDLEHGFCVHRSKRVQPRQKEDLERLAQYIIRNPFSVEKMHPDPGSGTIIYRSGMNPKIRRNFEIFTPNDFIAAITQHIPDKSFQLVRYYGWYSNKMRGQRNKQAAGRDGAGKPPGSGIEIIDVSEHRPRRPPSPKWRVLIKKVWESDPLICPVCSREMRIVALIDERAVIERILRHLGLWEEGVRIHSARAPPTGGAIVELFPGDPFPDYTMDPVMDYDLCAKA